jgi:hypothetical protein
MSQPFVIQPSLPQLLSANPPRSHAHSDSTPAETAPEFREFLFRLSAAGQARNARVDVHTRHGRPLLALRARRRGVRARRTMVEEALAAVANGGWEALRPVAEPAPAAQPAALASTARAAAAVRPAIALPPPDLRLAERISLYGAGSAAVRP